MERDGLKTDRKYVCASDTHKFKIYNDVRNRSAQRFAWDRNKTSV